jgi:coenzyme PQQ precursor peptide PqqA
LPAAEYTWNIGEFWRFGIERFSQEILAIRRNSMKLEWHKPEVVEEEVGLEVTSYAPAELDRS